MDGGIVSEPLVVAEQLPAKLASCSQDDGIRQAQTIVMGPEHGGMFGRPRVQG